MIHDENLRQAHERRTAPHSGVTLAGFYGPDKPPALIEVIAEIQSRLGRALGHFRGLLRPAGSSIHATIAGLEGSRDDCGEIMLANTASRARAAGEPARGFAIDEFVAFLRQFPGDMRFQFGGYTPEQVNPHDKERSPWARTFEFRNDGLAVLIGWPTRDGQPFAPDLDGLRRRLQQFGIVHKYHLDPAAVDNDLFIVVAALDHLVWTELSAVDRQHIASRLDAVQQELRMHLERCPVFIDLPRDRLWIVKYCRSTLEEVEFARRITEVSAGELRSLYTR